MPVLSIQNLKISFRTENNLVRAVDDVSFDLDEGKILGVVGESGSGKSVTAMSILKLIDVPPGRYDGGEILFQGQNLLSLSEAGIRRIRGNDISMIFQDPMTSLNPFLTIGRQLTEVIETHEGISGANVERRCIEMLERVGIPAAERRFRMYPHEFSGGMRQRVMIAMALLLKPKILIADEPTTALDVTTQAQILSLIQELRENFGTSVILITHDLGVVAGVADHVAVMYAGKIVEYGVIDEIFGTRAHPYTQGLLRSLPKLTDDEEKEKLEAIPGLPPDLSNLPKGCPFHPRCSQKVSQCSETYPEKKAISASHWASCFVVPTLETKEIPS